MLLLKKIGGKVIAFLFLFLMSLPSHGQRVFVNTTTNIYELTGTAGNCSVRDLGRFCLQEYGGVIFSSAFHNDYFYFISGESNNLYRVPLNAPGNCTFLTSFPTYGPFGGSSTVNSLTIDKNGILYAADSYSSRLFSYNPATGQQILLGQLPASPAGDLLFYYDKLLYAAMGNTLYEVDLSNPAASQIYMNTNPHEFYGIISFPFECKKNRVFGISASRKLVELDLENKTIIGIACTFPWDPYDAASEVEDGTTIGVSIDSIKINAPCNPQDVVGSVQIGGSTVGGGNLTYTLDNINTNSTGGFGNLVMGVHHIKISNAQGCFKDSTFTIAHGISPGLQIIRQDPESCDLQNGSLTVNAFSNYSITYSINNGPYQAINTFSNLAAGVYHIRIKDSGGCQRDTQVVLNYRIRPDYIREVNISPTYCNNKSGSITVQANFNDVTASIDNGQAVSNMVFTNLDAGLHLISVFRANNCRYDTLIDIKKIEDPAPAIQISTVNQVCFDNNGSIVISATGNAAPYTFALNGTGFTSRTHYDQLVPASYIINIKSNNGCIWQMPAEILAYQKKPFTYDLKIEPATCEELKSGEINLAVTGEEIPYSLVFDRRVYPASITIPRLEPGKYGIQVVNREGCVLDTVWANLGFTWSAECDKVMIPSAFTPNGDGLNDLFSPIYGPYIKNTLFTVYNRYGQIVYQSKSGGKGWDGTSKGRSLHSDVYVWTFYYESSRGEQKFQKGQITLIR